LLLGAVLLASCTHRAPPRLVRSSASVASAPFERGLEAIPPPEHDPVDNVIAGIRANAPPPPTAERPRVEAVDIRIQDLTQVHVPPPRGDGKAIFGRPPVASALLQLDGRRQMVSARWVGWRGHVFGDYDTAHSLCGSTQAKRKPWQTRFESLVATADSEATYTVGDGVLASSSCRVGVRKLVTAQARRLDPTGALYAYVDPGVDGDDVARLVVLFPATETAVTTGEGAETDVHGIGHARLPLRRGTGASLFAEIARDDVREWLASTRQARSGSQRADRLRIGVEVVWPSDQRQAEVIAYATWIGVTGERVE